jgi:hypothetical protein
MEYVCLLACSICRLQLSSPLDVTAGKKQPVQLKGVSCGGVSEMNKLLDCMYKQFVMLDLAT